MVALSTYVLGVLTCAVGFVVSLHVGNPYIFIACGIGLFTCIVGFALEL
jgi:hypothetical protein